MHACMNTTLTYCFKCHRDFATSIECMDHAACRTARVSEIRTNINDSYVDQYTVPPTRQVINYDTCAVQGF